MSGLLTYKLSWSFEDGRSYIPQQNQKNNKKKQYVFPLAQKMLAYCTSSAMNSTAQGRKSVFGLFGK